MEQYIKADWLGIARMGSAAVYIGVVAFADILFLVLMGSIFPPGPLSALATFGAVAGGLSALVLPIALHHWFAPVKQFAFGVVFLAVEWAVLGLNVLLSYQVWEISQASPGLARIDALTRLPDWLAGWAVFSPASPLVALIGWGVVYMLDPDIQLSWAKKIKAIMEMKAEVAQHEGEIEQRKIYNAHFLEAARTSPEVAERLRLGAARDAAIYAAKLTGDAYPVAMHSARLDAPAPLGAVTAFASDAPMPRFAVGAPPVDAREDDAEKA